MMTEEQLKENGYPMPCPEKPGRAIVFTAEEKKTVDSKCRSGQSGKGICAFSGKVA